MDKYEKIKLENQLCFSLYAASREVIKLYKPLLDKYGLTYTQYIAMIVVWEHEKITVKEMGQKLHLDSGTLTPVLKKLESMDLITKYRDKNDDRVVIVELIEKGRSLKEEILDVPNQIFCMIGADNEEIVALKEMLDQLLTKFKK
ncbi:MarR family winged helix-turn-helix transcriptional regulator [Anaerosporobacter sp.]